MFSNPVPKSVCARTDRPLQQIALAALCQLSPTVLLAVPPFVERAPPFRVTGLDW